MRFEILVRPDELAPADADRYFRTAYLPLAGPTAYLVWSTVGAALHEVPVVFADEQDLAARLGVRPPRIEGALDRLRRFRLAEPLAVDAWALCLVPPVLPLRQAHRLPARVRAELVALERSA
jgi:hypothetical protein